MDKVFVESLKIEAIVGVLAWERQMEQRLLVDLEVTTDFRAAAASDQVADAVNYVELADEIQQVIQQGKFQLLETAAQKSAESLLEKFPISAVKLTIRKPNILPNATHVGVSVVREK